YLDFFKRAIQNTKVGATIFGYVVQDPERYGVVEFDAQDRVISLEEKPKHPKSHYAVPGLYVYDNQVVQIAKSLKPSPRGELEITDLNRVYLELGQLMVQKIGRGVAWLDTGTPQALLEANNFIGAVEQRQGMMIGCIEEAALRAGFLTIEQYQKMLEQIPKSPYRQYLERIAIEP
ncbi:MAG TPA: sugar phosphate nucleotidyltransferase, partial [Bacteroidia bacterium]|nr:sugar phosphate nucleotidyltransferase [Bacteroidia bacterium]